MKKSRALRKAPSLDRLARTSVEAAHAAGEVLAYYFDKKLRIREKPGAGLVTQADTEAESAALKVLKRDFPEFGFLTEESPEEGAGRDGRFVLDPLDGTTNFVHRFPMFCVSLAAEWEDQVVVGVIYHPILKETYLGIRGKGARVNGNRLRVSTTTELRDTLLTTGFTYQKEVHLRKEMEAFTQLSGIARAVRRPGSAALDLAYTARGVFDGFWERGLSAWDVAAGSLLIEEAGGKVTNFQGKGFDIRAREILATNGLVHGALRKIIQPG